MLQNADERVIKNSLNLFLVLFLLIGAILGGAIAIFYRAELNTYISELKVRERYTIELQSSVIGNEFDSIVSDLLFLANQNELFHYCESGTQDGSENIAEEYKVLARTKRIYDQIRYLGAGGMELVRVNFNSGKPEIVPHKYLQNKSKRYYFKDAFRLQENEIFVSPLDLNIERGKIEQPLKPMIRFATPVFDEKDEKRGIVLLNYLAENLLERIARIGSESHSTKMLLNSDGYWLLSPNKEEEWGFMFEELSKTSFALAYPDEWKTMRDNQAGQMQNRNGLFTYTTVYPLQEGFQSSSGSNKPYAPSVKSLNTSDYFWVLVSHIPPGIMGDYSHNLVLKLFVLGAGLFVLISFGAWFLALAITKRRIYQAQLIAMALYDSLTGLPNRKLFFDRLTLGLEQAERRKCRLGLLYIDLDGFKKVNDTMGHEVGDELLIRVGELFTRCLRKSDTVARLGGDEFAVILSEINNLEDCKLAADKILKALADPIMVKAGLVSIGASIGAAVYPDHETNREKLIKRADMAMYKAKGQAKDSSVVVNLE
ncbi:MAG: hypothetical protein BA863_02225 [Desulfovibrio sp. S3730MH75]|nr:MAG: hypothetical protein BA863_02225 [Desulfovibrio sp. S3730MH75]